jgi:hypothetical protein
MSEDNNDASELRSDHPEGEPALAARCIAALLTRHGIPKYRFAVTVSEILGLSRRKPSPDDECLLVA